jgi:Pvc16 N-terminal domain
MSNALAIATVTETLFNVLTKALPASLVNGAQVTVLRPDDTSLQGAAAKPGVNIFLYQVAPNVAWRNADLPTRKSDGSLMRRPQVALDLHYLISFYGSDTAFEQQRLLGTVSRALHAAPTLDRATVKTTEGQVDGSGNRIFDSHLSDQLDLVRFTPINFSLEEMSKLWSVFLKTDYVLSLAYIASVVLIETDEPPPAGALRVLEPCIVAVPFSLAIINTIEPQAFVVATAGPTTIILHGQGLNAENEVAFTTPGKTEPILGTIEPGSTSDALIVTLPAGLRPGVNTVQLTQTAPAASPPECSPHVLSQSNAVAFVILPALIQIMPASPPGHLVAVVSPTVGPRQQVSLVLNQLAGSPPTGPLAFVLPADPHDTETDTFSFSTLFPDPSDPTKTVSVPNGIYLARVRVDTAESRLSVDASGTFNGPLITIA